jgi:hypothetical protein
MARKILNFVDGCLITFTLRLQRTYTTEGEGALSKSAVPRTASIPYHPGNCITETASCIPRTSEAITNDTDEK